MNWVKCTLATDRENTVWVNLDRVQFFDRDTKINVTRMVFGTDEDYVDAVDVIEAPEDILRIGSGFSRAVQI
jgi:hypothetical protein